MLFCMFFLGVQNEAVAQQYTPNAQAAALAGNTTVEDAFKNDASSFTVTEDKDAVLILKEALLAVEATAHVDNGLSATEEVAYNVKHGFILNTINTMQTGSGLMEALQDSYGKAVIENDSYGVQVNVDVITDEIINLFK